MGVLSAEQLASWCSQWQAQAASGSLDMLLLSEVGHVNPELPGFVLYEGLRYAGRSDVGAGRGQGLCLYVREGLAQFCSLVKTCHCAVWVKLRLPGKAPLFVCSVYLPPQGSRYWSPQQVDMLHSGDMVDTFHELQSDVALLSQQGGVCVFGDMNALTGSLDDRAQEADGVIQDMGSPAIATALRAVPDRRNSDVRPPNQAGRLLVELCNSAGCVLLNGRARGDEQGAPTHRPYGSRAGAVRGGVLDYGLVSAEMYARVESFTVVCDEDIRATSDHNALRCSMSIPMLSGGRRGQAGGSGVCMVKWDSSRRGEYRLLVASQAYAERRAEVLEGLRLGFLTTAEASSLWCGVLLDAAEAVFGRSEGARLRGGRPKKWWFRHCKEEHAALRAALRDGNSHAAAAARNRFNARKRAVQRQAAVRAEREWMADIKHNPRRFWTQYRGGRGADSLHSLESLTEHWESLLRVDTPGSLSDVYESVPRCVEALSASPASDSARRQAAAALNSPVSIEEVEAAVRKLKLGRMAGPDGVRGELIREVYTVEVVELPDGKVVCRHVYDQEEGSVLHDLTCLLRAAFEAGDVPPCWGSCFLSAVFKKGDPTVLDNYRGIAVGSAVGKVFSLVLHARLNGWAEDQGLRATGQAGFREGKCTNNHIFVLKHLIDRCQGSDRVYACFIDFRKAYDLVRRDLLLQCLADMGLHGSMLSCLVSMYWSTPMLVKNGSEVGGQVDSNIGVKQGDPLSPLLFGLFIDRVEAWLRDKASQCGVELGGALLRVLLYADDLTLLARSPADLQTLLDALSEFCSANCLYVNVAKSAVMVFGRQKPRVGVHIPPAGWVFEGAQLPVVSEFRYLGITFHETSGVSACTSALAAAAMRAMWGVLARCKSMEMPTLALRMSLFEYIVAPILTYGSEVWGPTVLAPCSTVQKCLGLSLLRPLFVFLRRLGGNLRRGTSSQLLLREFGAKPLARAWLRACIQLWNRGVQLPSSDPMARALAENVSMTHRPARVWSVGLETVLRRIHALPAGGLVAGGEGTPLARLDEAEILRCFDEWFVSGYHDLPADPRSAPSTSVTLCTYERWFSVDPIADNYVEGRWSGVPQYVCQTAGIPAHHVRSLAAFRLGAHHYDVATGRWARQPRHQRICSVCHTGVGDEWHVVFECEGQQVPRQQHAPLFQAFGGWASPAPDSLPSDSLREFMAQCPRRVAAFLYACEQRASQLPPDEVLFGDPISDPLSEAEFLDCLE